MSEETAKITTSPKPQESGYQFTKSNTIQDRSSIYFNTPSSWAEQNLFNLQMYGHFVCDSRYEVSRGAFDSYLLFLTLNGEGTVRTPSGERKCRREEIALIDCSEPHRYYADNKWEFIWIHFNGEHVRELVRMVLKSHGNVMPMPETSLTYRFMNLIVFRRMGTTMAEEVTVSAYIHYFLAEMLNAAAADVRVDEDENMVSEAIGYIQENYQKKLDVAEIAKFLRVSKSKFCHEFRDRTGISPYAYIIQVRINEAKKLLVQTNESISQISEDVGFSSDANFIKTFHDKVKQTPREFRNSGLFKGDAGPEE